jgi:hypothetical protein
MVADICNIVPGGMQGGKIHAKNVHLGGKDSN